MLFPCSGLKGPAQKNKIGIRVLSFHFGWELFFGLSGQGDELKMAAFWETAPCSIVEVDRRFSGTYCLQH
jgi:hypothetical protein